MKTKINAFHLSHLGIGPGGTLGLGLAGRVGLQIVLVDRRLLLQQCVHLGALGQYLRPAGYRCRIGIGGFRRGTAGGSGGVRAAERRVEPDDRGGIIAKHGGGGITATRGVDW